MRAKEGSRVALFNGVDGEWEAEVVMINRKRCELAIRRQLRPQPPATPAPTLLFAVLKGGTSPCSCLIMVADSPGLLAVRPTS